uniref:Uncharacterized protein n=2 Tax=Physcomitrium patens TaxID=3218 RepID=A0A7I4ELI4_PHYPA
MLFRSVVDFSITPPQQARRQVGRQAGSQAGKASSSLCQRLPTSQCRAFAVPLLLFSSFSSSSILFFPPRSAPRCLPASLVRGSLARMDVVMMNDFDQRHLANKSRSHSPYGHIGSPTTPLNFDHLFLQSQVPLNSDLSHQIMLQAQLLNNMRSTGMGPKPKQQSQQPLATLDQLRHAYNRGDQDQGYGVGEQEQAEWSPRLFSAAAAQQQQHQHQQTQDQVMREELPNEPSSIALVNKFAQYERYRAEIQKSSSQPPQMQSQMYPLAWPVAAQQQSISMAQSSVAPPVSSAVYSDSRHSAYSNGRFYPYQNQHHHQQPQYQHVSMEEAPEQFYGSKTEANWQASQDGRANIGGAGWSVGNAAAPSYEVGTNSPRFYMSQPFQQPQPVAFQPQQPKMVSYQQPMQQHQRVAEFVVPQAQPFSGFELNGVPASEMGMSGPAMVSSRCDKTGGQSVEIMNVAEHHGDDSEKTVDNFSGRLSSLICRTSGGSVPSSQITFSNNFHMLPQSSKSAFSTFTRPSSNLNPATEVEFVTRSLLFNDTYKSSEGDYEMMHEDVDTELRL